MRGVESCSAIVDWLLPAGLGVPWTVEPVIGTSLNRKGIRDVSTDIWETGTTGCCGLEVSVGQARAEAELIVPPAHKWTR